MPDLTFAAIQALSDDALNTLIDRHCTTHQWIPDPRNGYDYYKLEHPDIGLGRMWSTVPHRHYTRSGERLMPLCCRAGVRLRHHGETWHISDGAGVYRLEAHTEADARRRIAELVLWEGVQRQQGAQRYEAATRHGCPDAGLQ